MTRGPLQNPDTIDWEAPYRFGENLRVLQPIIKFGLSGKTKRDLANMPREYRERLEREWLDAEAAVPPVSNPISAELQERAALEWDGLVAINDLERRDG